MALRSIERHAVGLRRVVVLGAIPSWLRETDRVQPVPLKEFQTNKASRISQKVLWAFEHLDLTPAIAFWNDDYLMLRAQDIRSIPAIYRKELWRRPSGGWRKLLRHTAQALHAAGFTQHHFDIHVPIVYDRDKFVGIRDWWERSRLDALGYVAKSVYGNVVSVPHEKSVVLGRDSKVQGNWKGRIDDIAARRWVVSYGDGALQAGFADWMQSRFPDPTAAETTARPPPRKTRRRRTIKVCCQ
jgi:hypothetical protein